MNPLVVEPRPLTDYIYLQGLPRPCYPSVANEWCHGGAAELLPPRLNVSQGVLDVLRAMVKDKTAAAAKAQRCVKSSPGSDEWNKCHATPPSPRQPAGGGGRSGGGTLAIAALSVFGVVGCLWAALKVRSFKLVSPGQIVLLEQHAAEERWSSTVSSPP
eukprot:COSAG01_NODE_1247_length_11073_cov_23.273465_13_plen_159_part_00